MTVTIQPEGPQRDDLPADVAAALQAHPQAGAFFDSLAQPGGPTYAGSKPPNADQTNAPNASPRRSNYLKPATKSAPTHPATSPRCGTAELGRHHSAARVPPTRSQGRQTSGQHAMISTYCAAEI